MTLYFLPFETRERLNVSRAQDCSRTAAVQAQWERDGRGGSAESRNPRWSGQEGGVCIAPSPAGRAVARPTPSYGSSTPGHGKVSSKKRSALTARAMLSGHRFVSYATIVSRQHGNHYAILAGDSTRSPSQRAPAGLAPRCQAGKTWCSASSGETFPVNDEFESSGRSEVCHSAR